MAGCGSDKGERRDAVNDYVQRVNALQGRYKGSIARANRAYRAFSGGRASRRELARLRAAQAGIVAMRAELRQLEPPPDARKLHGDLLEFLHLEQGIALEVTEFEQYVPQVTAALGDLGKLNAAFRSGFAAATTAEEQERVFGDYASSLRRAAARLDRLGAPPALAPWQATEVKRLRRTATAAAGLREALLARDREQIQRQVDAFSAAASETRAQREAQRTAIKAYNARLVRIAKAAARVERDREKLQNELG